MKRFLIITAAFFITNSVALANKTTTTTKEKNKTIKIVNAQSESAAGPVETFTGKVRVTTVLTPEDSASVSCASVAFEAGSRSAWHSHPKGQLLVVTQGSGLIQAEGQPVRRIKVGDTIWTPPNVKHWHGASPSSAMVHTATQEIVNGTPVTWMEKVSDEQYEATPQ
jgi:4-carboxymuconolactone decarboxylase